MNHGRPGTHLKRILQSIAITPKESCPCDAFAAEMDTWGIEGCTLRRTRIAAKLQENARKWNWREKLVAGLAAVSNGVAFRLRLTTPYLALVEEAIRQAEAAWAVDPERESAKFRATRGDRRLSRHLVLASMPGEMIPTLPAPIADCRNLMYHLWPTKHNQNWRWNVDQLCRRIDLCNGVRSVGVALDASTVTLAEVKDAFGPTRINHWITKANDPKIREGATFLDLMETMPRDDSVTCYAHAKGVRHDDRSLTIPWAEMLYKATFDRWPEVATLLLAFPMVGTFKRYGMFRLNQNHRWHYSGTFFWFRNDVTFNRPTWSYLHPKFFACVEAWPANVYAAHETACLFGDNAGDLYRPEELQRHIAAMNLMEEQCNVSN